MSGHLGCTVGTERTDVAHVPLALDARTWPREDDPGLGLTDEDAGLLSGRGCEIPAQGLI